MEVLYKDNFPLCWENLDEAMEKYDRWWRVLEGKGLRINVDKTKGR